MSDSYTGGQWSAEYKLIRSQIFQHRIDIGKLLPLNRASTKLKQDVLKMEASIDNEEFSREIEYKKIIDTIRSLKKAS